MRTRTKILICLALAVLWFRGCQVRAVERCVLEKDYEVFNQDYFLGQLPPANVEWANLTDQHDMGMTWVDQAGARQIRVDKSTNPVLKQAEMTLLHEMCHVKTDAKELDSHGLKWQACMVDLADHGAFHDLW